MSRTNRLLVAAVATTALVGLAAPAQADLEIVRDARGDRVRVHGMSVASSTDILRTVARHAGGRLSVTIHLVDLTAGNGLGEAALVTDEGRYRLSTNRFRTRTRSYLYEEEDYHRVACDGLRGQFDNARDTITMSVPRSCVDGPRWIRFGASVFSSTGGDTFIDDARRRGGGFERGIRVGQRKLRHN